MDRVKSYLAKPYEAYFYETLSRWRSMAGSMGFVNEIAIFQAEGEEKLINRIGSSERNDIEGTHLLPVAIKNLSN